MNQDDAMVMDVYRSLVPKPSGAIYVLEKIVELPFEPKNLYTSEELEPVVVLLGIFDELETALHALDLTSKYRARDMKERDSLEVRRIRKNTLNMEKTVMARWECTGESKKGIFEGRIQLCDGLRTHDVEQ